MKKIMVTSGKILVGVLLLTLAVALGRLAWAHGQVAQVDAAPAPAPLAADTTPALTILPLYEEASAGPGFESGHGVSYLVRTAETTILMDLGANPEESEILPAFANLAEAGLRPDAADLLFISHTHPDHIGGLRWQPARLAGADNLAAATFPVEMALPNVHVTVGTQPQMIAPGVATLGRMPFVQPFPFWLWEPLGYEQVLAVNVAGEGIVLITGCGHPSLERMVVRAEALFAAPVVGVVGGLHYEGLEPEALAPHLAFLAERSPRLVALSPHDNGTVAISAFRDAFPAAYQTVEVGTPLAFGRPMPETETN